MTEFKFMNDLDKDNVNSYANLCVQKEIAYQLKRIADSLEARDKNGK